MDNNIAIRKAVDEDYPFLEEMLYESILEFKLFKEQESDYLMLKTITKA